MSYVIQQSSMCIQFMRCRTSSSTIVQKRFRYYWEARSECRERKRLMQITLPRLTPRKPPLKSEKIERKLYGLDVLLHKEVQEIFNKSRMIAVCLYSEQNPDDFYRIRHELLQNEMCMEKYDDHVVDFTLRGTSYENFLTLFDGPSTIVFGEPNVKEMMTAIKKNRHLLLIGGMIDGKLMSVSDLLSYAELRGLDEERAKLSGILSTATSSTYNLLNKPASNLTQLLAQYIGDKKASGNESTSK